jgi:pimeloyl-ACP methyl ester carboxylesterase
MATGSSPNLFRLIALNYEHAVRAIIRPPRASYAAADLGPPEFVLPGGDPKVRYRRSDAELSNSAGAKLHCSHWEPVHRPRDASGRPISVLPCVVYLHGNSSCRVAAMEVLPLVLAAGWTCVAFDFMGCGRSDGEWVTLGHSEQGDLECVLAALRARGPAASELGMAGRATGRVALYGRSMGAATAILAAARDPSIAAVVADSPFSSLRGLIEELLRRARAHAGCAGALLPSCVLAGFLGLVRRTVRARTGMDLNELSPEAAAARAAQPALFCAGSDDHFVSPAHAAACAAAWAGADKAFFELPGCDHNTARPAEWFDRVRAFLARALDAPPGAAAVEARAAAAAAAPASPPPAAPAQPPPPPPAPAAPLTPSKRVARGAGLSAAAPLDATLRGGGGGAAAAPVRPPPLPTPRAPAAGSGSGASSSGGPLSPGARRPAPLLPGDPLAMLASSPETAGRWAGMRVAKGRGSPATASAAPNRRGSATNTEGEEEEEEGGEAGGEEAEGGALGALGEVVAGEGVVLVVE